MQDFSVCLIRSTEITDQLAVLTMPKNTIGKIGWFFTNSNTTGVQFIGGGLCDDMVCEEGSVVKSWKMSNEALCTSTLMQSFWIDTGGKSRSNTSV
jgi:hypothetical protein